MFKETVLQIYKPKHKANGVNIQVLNKKAQNYINKLLHLYNFKIQMYGEYKKCAFYFLGQWLDRTTLYMCINLSFSDVEVQLKLTRTTVKHIRDKT